MLKFLEAPKRLILNRLKRRRKRTMRLTYIDQDQIPMTGKKVIADSEYQDIYEDPYLLK